MLHSEAELRLADLCGRPKRLPPPVRAAGACAGRGSCASDCGKVIGKHQHGLTLPNRTSASVFGHDVHRALSEALQIDAGCVRVNGATVLTA